MTNNDIIEYLNDLIIEKKETLDDLKKDKNFIIYENNVLTLDNKTKISILSDLIDKKLYRQSGLFSRHLSQLMFDKKINKKEFKKEFFNLLNNQKINFLHNYTFFTIFNTLFANEKKEEIIKDIKKINKIIIKNNISNNNFNAFYADFLDFIYDENFEKNIVDNEDVKNIIKINFKKLLSNFFVIENGYNVTNFINIYYDFVNKKLNEYRKFSFLKNENFYEIDTKILEKLKSSKKININYLFLNTFYLTNQNNNLQKIIDELKLTEQILDKYYKDKDQLKNTIFNEIIKDLTKTALYISWQSYNTEREYNAINSKIKDFIKGINIIKLSEEQENKIFYNILLEYKNLQPFNSNSLILKTLLEKDILNYQIKPLNNTTKKNNFKI